MMMPSMLALILLVVLGEYLPEGVSLDSKSGQLGGSVIFLLVVLMLAGMGLVVVGLILSPDIETQGNESKITDTEHLSCLR